MVRKKLCLSITTEEEGVVDLEKKIQLTPLHAEKKGGRSSLSGKKRVFTDDRPLGRRKNPSSWGRREHYQAFEVYFRAGLEYFSRGKKRSSF